MNVLVLEASTTSAKAMLYHTEDHSFEVRVRAYTGNYEDVTIHNAENVYRDMVQVGRELVAGRRVDMIALSGTWHSLMLCGRDMRLTTPVYLWSYTGAAAVCKKLRQDPEYVRSFYQKTGCMVNAVYPFFKDIASVADLSGLKIRTMANEIHLAAWKAMGANPTPMAFGELFTAMQQGTVDGQENPLGIITGNKFEEIEKYCTLTEHVYTPYYVVMNMDKWNSLSAEQQEALTKAMAETTARQYELSQEYEDKAVETMETAGCAVRTLTDEEKMGFKEAADKANSLDAAKKIMYKPELADQMAQELNAYRNK